MDAYAARPERLAEEMKIIEATATGTGKRQRAPDAVSVRRAMLRSGCVCAQPMPCAP